MKKRIIEKKKSQIEIDQYQKSRSNIGEITKYTPPKKKQSEIQTPILHQKFLPKTLTSISIPQSTHKKPIYIFLSLYMHTYIYIYIQRKRKRDYEVNRGFDVLNERGATLSLSRVVAAMVSPNVLPLHHTKSSISKSITIPMPIHLYSLFLLFTHATSSL